MQCQRCDKTATFHITELTGGKPEEVHLCKDCAREYLTQTEGEEAVAAPNLASALAQQLVVGQAAEELARLDQRACPVCGMTFFEFRSTGRLGCPNDYVFFESELSPLILNIHGETEHHGKQPKQFVGDTDEQTNLIRLRREMKEAVKEEDYEEASRLRDEIHRVELATGKVPSSGEPDGGESDTGESDTGRSATGESSSGASPDQAADDA